MIVAFWIVNGLLALAFFASGVRKLVSTREALAAGGIHWVDDAKTVHVKLIGALEVLGAIGLVLPVLLNIAPILTPITSVLFAVLMVAGTVVHVRRKENPAVSLVLLALSIVSAVLGFLVVLG